MLQNYNIWRVASVFFHEPTKEHYLIEISRKSGLAHTSVAIVLSELEKQGLVTKRIERRNSRDFPLYQARFQEKDFRLEKRFFNIYQLHSCGLVAFLHDELMPAATVLFGSFSRGEDIEDSDIDLFVQATETAVDLSRFEFQLHRKIHILFRRDFRKLSKELKSNIVNGIVLDGYLEAY
jgi:predicted nucleotidyltransferase